EDNIGRIIVNTRDVTDRLKLEENLNLMSQAINQSGNMVSFSNLDGKIEYINAAFLRLTGYESQDVLGKSYMQLNFAAPEIAEEIRKQLKSGSEWRGDIKHTNKDGY